MNITDTSHDEWIKLLCNDQLNSTVKGIREGLDKGPIGGENGLYVTAKLGPNNGQTVLYLFVTKFFKETRLLLGVESEIALSTIPDERMKLITGDYHKYVELTSFEVDNFTTL